MSMVEEGGIGVEAGAEGLGVLSGADELGGGTGPMRMFVSGAAPELGVGAVLSVAGGGEGGVTAAGGEADGVVMAMGELAAVRATPSTW